MDKEFIKKYGLEEACNRIKLITEYGYITSADEEDGQPQDPNGMNMPPQDPNGGGMGGQQMPPMGDDPNGGMPPAGDPNMGGQQPPMDPGMGGDPNGDMPMGDPGMGDQQPPMGGEDPMGDPGMGGDMPPMDGGTEPMQSDDEVIDVDDLTQSQETTEYKIDGVNDKLTTLLDVTSKFVEALKQNDEKIEDLKKEIERRNPTDEEQINIRSMASYPYSETPKDFWDVKQKYRPNYTIMSDNSVSPDDEQKEFTLRRDELKKDNDATLYKTLEYPLDLKDILDFEK